MSSAALNVPDHNARLAALLSKRKRFAAEWTGPPLSGKTLALGEAASLAAGVWGCAVERFALLAPTTAGARVLRRAVTDAAFGPGFPLTNLFERGVELTGAIADVAYAHSPQRARVTPQLQKAAAAEYCARIRRAAGIAPGDPAGVRFMRARLRQVSAAIGFLDHVWLQRQDLAEAYSAGLERGLDLPNPTQWLDLIEFWAHFKTRERAVEASDILSGPLYPDDACPLVLFDDADEAGPLARDAVARLFPRAAVLISAAAPGCLGRPLAGSFALG